MSLTFAYKWNRDDETFTYQHARNLLRSAVTDPNGGALKSEIDNGTARVISAPHKTPWGDTRRHLTVHCAVMMQTWHVYISKQGNFSGLDREAQTPGKKPGHALDDRDAPQVTNSAAL